MRNIYNVKELNPRKNPYIIHEQSFQQVVLNVDVLQLRSMNAVETKTNYLREYPCCREGTISDFHDVCMICGWEDDEVQNSNTLYSGGANKESLEQHRKTFLKLREKNKNYMWCNTWK